MNLGFGELVIILLIILLFVGARRLPEMGRALGKAIHEFRRGTQGDQDTPDDPAKKS